MTRKEFLKLAAGPTALTALPLSRTLADAPAQTIQLGNSAFQLTQAPGTGLKTRLVHVPTGMVLADGTYSYGCGNPVFGDGWAGSRGNLSGVTLNGVSRLIGAIFDSRERRRAPSWHITFYAISSHSIVLNRLTILD